MPRTKIDSSQTVERILDAAQQVLVTHGGIRFTMRLVARSARISPGNLTYHFPTKNALLRAVATRIIVSFIWGMANLGKESIYPKSTYRTVGYRILFFHERASMSS